MSDELERRLQVRAAEEPEEPEAPEPPRDRPMEPVRAPDRWVMLDPRRGFKKYLPTGSEVYARRMKERFIIERFGEDPLSGEPGDWLVFTPDGTYNVMNDEDFRSNYIEA